MRVLDLFSGIGGFSLGLERAGMQTVAFCEIEPFCRAVLRKHWPEVPIYEDIRTLTADVLERDGIAIDVICGGFPCQDLSFAGRRAGLEGERSGLWGEYRRLIGELRPRFVIVENVPGLLSLGMGTVLGDLASLGYDAWWDCIPASAVGAPHRRDRVWIIAADANSSRKPVGTVNAEASRMQEFVAHASGRVRQRGASRDQGHVALRSEDVADTNNARLEGRQRGSLPERTGERTAGAGGSPVPDASRSEREGQRSVTGGEQGGLADGSGRQPERGLGRMVDGVSDFVDPGSWLEEPQGVPRVTKGQENRASRLKALGNAVVPQIPFLIGRAIMEAQREQD